MGNLTPVLGKLEKLLPMLSSDKSGEIVAAVGAISRALKSCGCDWHDLTNQLTAKADTAAIYAKARADADIAAKAKYDAAVAAVQARARAEADARAKADADAAAARGRSAPKGSFWDLKDDDFVALLGLARKLLSLPSSVFPDKHRDFIQNIIPRLERFDTISEKQHAYLVDLCARYLRVQV